MTTPTPSGTPGHIPSLDGLRALSFLLVFVAHCGLDRYVPGGFGVTIFFFLSGFLITTLLRAEYQRRGRVDMRHFWLRRLLRIWPPFYLVLLTAIALAWIFDPPGTLYPLAVNAQLLHFTNYWIIFHGYAGQPAGTGVYWSLAVEEHFSLAFPWLSVGMQKLRLTPARQAVVLWTLCAAVLAWRCILVFGQHVSIDRTYMGSDTRIDSILFGCALAVWKNPAIDQPRLNERQWKYLLFPGALGLFLGCLLIRDDAFRETVRYSIQGVALSLLFVAAIRLAHWGPFRVLNWRPVAFLGALSYSLYLLHYAVIFAVERVLPAAPPALRGVVALLASVALAWVIYLLIEKPCAQLRKRLTDSVAPRAVSIPSHATFVGTGHRHQA